MPPPTSEQGLGRQQLTNGNRSDTLGASHRELRIERLVVLAVIADQNPLEVRKLRSQSLEFVTLVGAHPLCSSTLKPVFERGSLVELPSDFRGIYRGTFIHRHELCRHRSGELFTKLALTASYGRNVNYILANKTRMPSSLSRSGPQEGCVYHQHRR